MKNFRIFIGIVFCLCVSMLAIGCHRVAPDAEHEAVLVMRPWFFGHGGIDKTPVSTGLTWCVFTTSSVQFPIIPVRYDESFDDIFSNDNTPLDFNSYITIQIKKGCSPTLLENYGKDWYKNNIQVKYRNFTREEVSKYSPFDLISNREVLNLIDSAVINKMNEYIADLSAEKEFPIVIKNIVTGAARPNTDQLAEMNKTAEAIQKAKTQERLKEVYTIQEETEKQRAKADKAYMASMNLSAEQFIQLRYIEMIEKKEGANIDVMVGPATSMWNVRR